MTPALDIPVSLVLRLKRRIERTSKAMAAIPGEPCGCFAHQCSNPRHMEYHTMTLEREKLRAALSRAKSFK